MRVFRSGGAIAAHLLLSAVILFAFYSFKAPSLGALIAVLIIANAAPFLVRLLCLGLSHAPRDLPSNHSDLHDGPVHKNSPFIHNYPLIVMLFALFILLSSFIGGF